MLKPRYAYFFPARCVPVRLLPTENAFRRQNQWLTATNDPSFDGLYPCAVTLVASFGGGQAHVAQAMAGGKAHEFRAICPTLRADDVR